MTRRRELAAGGALALTGTLGWALVRTYPAFDSYFALVWGRELAHGHLPNYEVSAAPTPHPLWTLVAALASLIGRGGQRALVLVAVLSFVALVWGVARLGTAAWDLPRGLLAAALVATSFAFGLYAANAYVDVPFVALVAWAAALEQERPRRGRGPMVLLALAGLLRPEAWVLALLYLLWLWRGGALRAEHVALALAAPLVWGLSDLWVTGDALFSLHRTSAVADRVGQNVTALHVPGRIVSYLSGTVRAPVLLLGVAGVVLAIREGDTRRLAAPLTLAGAGVGAFLIAGIFVGTAEQRYLTVPAVAVCLFAAHALLGWRDRAEGDRVRRLWMRGAALAAALGVAGLAVLLPGSFSRLRAELRFIRSSHAELVALLHAPRVAGCRPLVFPTYRLVPVVRWELDLGPAPVLARNQRGAAGRGVQVYVTGGGRAVSNYGEAAGTPAATNAPPPAARPIARHGPFLAVGGCRG